MSEPIPNFRSTRELITELETWGDAYCRALPYSALATSLHKCQHLQGLANYTQYVLQASNVYFRKVRAGSAPVGQLLVGEIDAAAIFTRDNAHKTAFMLPSYGESNWTVIPRRQALEAATDRLIHALLRRLEVYELRSAIIEARLALEQPEFLRQTEEQLYALAVLLDHSHSGQHVLFDGLTYASIIDLDDQFNVIELDTGPAHLARPMSKDEAFRLRFILNEVTDQKWQVVPKDDALISAMSETRNTAEFFLGPTRP